MVVPYEPYCKYMQGSMALSYGMAEEYDLKIVL
jgi:hypothetical protein